MIHSDVRQQVEAIRRDRSVRNLVNAMQVEARDTVLTPDRASELCVKLTALLANVAEEIREADLDYAQVLLTYLDADEAANRATIRAQVSPEYQRKREARDTRELVIELVRSLKYLVRTYQEEMRLSR